MNKKKNHVCIVGAAIMDIMGFPDNGLKFEDSVLGKCKIAPGGVGRNIAENLARMDVPVNLITAFGNDAFSKQLIKEAKKVGIDISNSLFKKGSAATHLALMNKENDMTYGIAALDIIQKINKSALKKRKEVLVSAQIIIADVNIPLSSLEWLSTQSEFTQVYIDLVSSHFAKKIQPFIGNFHTVKANKMEAEMLTGMKIKTREDYKKIGQQLINKGSQRVFITAGSEGAFYCDDKTSGWINPIMITVKNTTGAGDAFMAGIAYASAKKLTTKECAQMGTAAASISLESKKVVSPKMTAVFLTNRIHKK